MSWHNDQVSRLETEKILEIARSSLAVKGDFVEFGCYKGDTSLLLAEVLRDFNNSLVEHPVEKSVKKLWIYDSFEGLPEKSTEDESVVGKDFKRGELMVSKKEVKARFLRAGLPVPKIIKSWFSDLKDTDLPEEIAFAFLDGDLYASIKDSLKLIENKMVSGGVIMVHDYANEALPGVAKAVDEFIQKSGYSLIRYESLAIIMIK